MYFKKFHTFCIFLNKFQNILGAFRLPHIIWKSLENGLMKSLYSGDAKTIKNKGKEEETDGSFGSLLKGKAQFLIQLR